METKQSRGDDTLFHTMGMVVVKNGWENGNKDSFMPNFFADGIGFAAALWAKLELEIQFLKKKFHILPKGERFFFRKNKMWFAVKKLGF